MEIRLAAISSQMVICQSYHENKSATNCCVSIF